MNKLTAVGVMLLTAVALLSSGCGGGGHLTPNAVTPPHNQGQVSAQGVNGPFGDPTLGDDGSLPAAPGQSWLEKFALGDEGPNYKVEGP